MDQGQLIYEIPREILRRKRVGSFGMAGYLTISLVALVVIIATNPISWSLDEISMLAIPLTTVPAVTIFFLWRGLRQNGFGITTKGIYPLVKPVGKLFSRRLFVPYSDILEIKTQYGPFHDRHGRTIEEHPDEAMLVLKNNETVSISVAGGLTPLGLYIWSEKNMRAIYRMMELVKQQIQEQRGKRANEITIPPEALQTAMGEIEKRLFPKQTKSEIRRSIGTVVLFVLMGTFILGSGLSIGVAKGFSQGAWVLVLGGSLIFFLAFLLGYSGRRTSSAIIPVRPEQF